MRSLRFVEGGEGRGDLVLTLFIYLLILFLFFSSL